MNLLINGRVSYHCQQSHLTKNKSRQTFADRSGEPKLQNKTQPWEIVTVKMIKLMK